MSLLRESLGDKFDQYKADGSVSCWMREPIGSLDRDELLALIGWLGEDRQRTQQQTRNAFDFMSKLRSKR